MPVMSVGKFLPFAGLFGRLSIYIFQEKIFPAVALRVFGLGPEPVHQVKIRTQRWEGVRVIGQQAGCRLLVYRAKRSGW